MSKSNTYLPIPPRVWSRVQNQCTFTVPGSTYTQAYIPLTNQTVSQAQADYEDKLIYKGNILQYKGNSSRLTKSQKYTQLAKGFGPNRTKVFASQSQTYTNPNTTGLQRVNYSTIPFPTAVVGEPNNISGPYQYDVANPNGCSGTSLQDGGTLRCGYYADPCTGEIIRSGATSATICNPASASGVPGSSILCWNNKVQTWFPRQRYVMNNSTDKWPVNYKGFVSATRPESPYLMIVSSSNTSVTLSWNYNNNNCLPISSFNVYQNGLLINTLPYTTTSTIINGLSNCSNYSFYITSVSNTIESERSNIVNIIIKFPLPPIITSGTASTLEQITLTWTQPFSCVTIQTWNIYYSTNSSGPYTSQTVSYSPSTTSTVINGLQNNTTYYIYMVTNSNNGDSLPSNIISVTIPPLYPPISISGNATGTNQITLSWIPDTSSSVQVVTDWYIYYSPSTSGPGSPIAITNSPTTSTVINGLTYNETYSIYIVAYNSTYDVSSNPSFTINVNVPFPFTATGTYSFTVDSNFNYAATFTGNGTITFNNSFNINIIAVGGGGGGGGGSNKQAGNPTESAGGGGGGGGVGKLNSFTASTGTVYDISIGTGGSGGGGNNSGGNGGNSSFKDSSLTNYLTATGGGAGNGHYFACSGGFDGSANSINAITTYSGANGGDGYQTAYQDQYQDIPSSTAQNGSNISPGMPIGPLPNGSSYYFSGGGGGGVYTSTYYGGLAGLDGSGGALGAYAIPSNGQSASSYGSGGGGAGCPYGTSPYNGGAGANGIVIIYFTY